MRDSHRSIVRVIAQRPARTITCAVLAVALIATPVLSPAAYAVSEETQAELDDAEAEVSSSTEAYNTAVSKLSDLEEQIEENEAAIEELEEQLPEKQQAASDAMREMYKYQQGSNPVVDIMVNASSLSDFVSTCAYMDQIQSSNNEVIEDLNDAQAELEEKQAELEEQKKELEEEKQNAADALAAAQQERQEAQEQAEAEAAAELAAAADDTGPAETETTSDDDEADDTAEAEETSSSSQSGDSENEYNTATESNQTASVEVDSSVDWSSSDRAAFIEEWGSRIDAYLSGSPLAGYGDTFAAAAWDYGVDPRWSPAISTVESSQGRYCFRSYNAWGWMGKSFSSWDEAIPAHVKYLKNTYGTTLTPAAAKRYCPPTWQDWYNKVAAEMNKI